MNNVKILLRVHVIIVNILFPQKFLELYQPNAQYLCFIYIYFVSPVSFGVTFTIIRENLKALHLNPLAVRQLLSMVITVLKS